MILLALSAAFAQAPSVPWKVVETEHYRVHYPLPAEEWALEAASQLEGIRDAVAEEVGWAPEFVVQVVVRDPVSEANGAVIPLPHSPRMELWTTPPGASSAIGHYRDPIEDLVLHEDVHVVHLLRPPRSLSGLLMQEVFRLAPVTRKSSRWVSEGYATLVEGRLTGGGRPHGDIRAVMLRRLAQQGALPSYGEMSFSNRWSGRGYAYLVGSAYLEWLERRAGPGSLRDLWARMSAKKTRSFDGAFEGVFGDDPVTLYRRFTAELTADAMAADGASLERSTLWMDTGWTVDRPAVSPDGTRLAAVQVDPIGPARLTVWKTEVDTKAQERLAERIADILANDPEDVGPVDPAHPPHATDTSYSHRTHPPSGPRWVDDTTLLYDAPRIDPGGRVRRDLYTLDVESGKTRRVTRFADVRDADPIPGRNEALAVRHDWGRTQLVRVDLTSGAILDAFAEPSVRAIVDQPRVSRDAGRVAFLQHVEGRYRPYVADLTPDGRVVGPVTELAVPDGGIVQHLSWTPDGDVLAAVGVGGRVDLWRLGGLPERLTSSGAAFAPEPAADGTFFLELQADGMEIHKLPADAGQVPDPEGDGGLAGRAPPVDPPEWPRAEVTGVGMGIGRLEPRILVGGQVGTRAANFELGVRLGDVVGRNELVVHGSLGDAAGATGGGLWMVNRTLPLDVEVRGWALQDGFDAPFGFGGALETGFDRVGGVGRLVGTAGFWGEAVPGGDSRLAGWTEWIGVVREPRTHGMRGHVVARGAAGQASGSPSLLGEAAVGVSVGRGWTVSADVGVGVATGVPFTLGGVGSSVRAEAAQWTRLRPGWVAPDAASAFLHDALDMAVGPSGVEAFVQRHRLWTDGVPASYALLGLRMRQDVGRQPLVRIPATTVEMGIGCAFEEDGPVEAACRKLGHYRGWTSIVWHR